MDIRPRTTGEILDDAWRLALADAPLLLALSGLFLTPAGLVLILLITQKPAAYPWLLPTVFALLVPLTGVGSGACQAVFRRRAEGEVVTFAGCLVEALRRSLDHAAARGLALAAGLLGSLILLMPGLGIWVGTATVHSILASGPTRWLPGLGAAGQESQRQPGKAAGVVLSRLPVLLLATLNLHVFIQVLLWTGDHLAGLDLALAGFVLGLHNPVYTVSLILLAWMLLAPYFEASNYLLHVDARARYEGLDLWYRARRLFPAGAKVGTVLGLLVLLGTAAPAFADQRLDTVRAARKELLRISSEVKTADDVENPRWARWNDELSSVSNRLDRDGSRQRGRYIWFAKALPAFEAADRAGKLRVLEVLDSRLAVIEESLAPADSPKGGLSKDKLKSLLPDAPEEPKNEPKQEQKQETPKAEEPVKRVEPANEAPPRRMREGPSVVSPQQGGGFSPPMWLMLLGGFVVVVVLAALLRSRERVAAAPKAAAPKAAVNELSLESLLIQPARTLENLWHQADDLARAGKSLDAVRTLYLAVLMLLHRSNLIRCGPMRTNGEYVRQVRDREDLYRPFRGLTGLFEVKWYGERSCEPADYDTCRRLAETIREGVKAGS